MRNKITLVIAIAITLLISTNSFAQTVTSGADDGTDGTLRNEIADTPIGGTITFMPSVTLVTLNSELVIDKNLTITGASVVIDANFNSRIFNITGGNVSLNNLTITNGIAPDGGGIYMTNATVTINDCTITNNVANSTGSPAGSGGGIFNDVGGILVVNDSEISSNIANRAGGGIEDKTAGGATITTTLNNVSLLNNNAGVAPAMAAPGNGGGIHVSSNGSVNITGGIASGNVAALEGGALWNGSGTMTVNGTTIDNNDAQGAGGDDGGGGIFNNGGTLIIQNGTTITNNSASGALGSGGGIFTLTPGTIDVDGLTIENNTANRAGGGIEINSAGGETYTFNDVTLTGNTVNGPAPGNGGGLHISGAGDIVYNGGTVSNNTAFEGGGLWNSVGLMSINGTTITGNAATGDATGGGGLFNNGGTLNVDAATSLTGNIASAATPGGRGGAIFNNTGGSLNLATDLTISGNYASRAGGAIEDSSGGTLTLDGVTLTGNSAGVDIGLGNSITANPGNGGAIHLSGTTNAIVNNSIITLNLAASEGGGLWNNLGSMTVDNTLVDGNDAQGADADTGGGGIFNNGGTLIVQALATITNNLASGTLGSGGGIFSTDGVVTVNTSWIAYNTSNRAGGGIEAIEGTINLINSTLDFNTTGSSPGNGGGLHITGSADANLLDGTVNSNTAAREGGGLWNGTGTMTVSGVTINGNTASGPAADDGGGGIFNNGGTLMVQNGTIISNNLADGTSGSGGGIFSLSGAMTVDNSNIQFNSANRAGGGVEVADGTAMFINNINLISNDVNGLASGSPNPGNGGALHATAASAVITFNGGSVFGNEAASEGGGLWNNAGIMNIEGTLINGNTAFGNDADNGGGGIFNNGGTLNVNALTEITDNYADGTSGSGGGIFSTDGVVTINGATITGNEAARAGGGIEVVNGTLFVTNTALNTNDAGSFAPAPGNGGGLHISGLANSTFTGGTVNNNVAAREGGGLWNGLGTMTIDGTTIDLNTANGPAADDGGGGIFNNGGTLVVQNSTIISNNSADGTSGSGGGIQNVDGGSVSVSDSSITGNSSNRAGGGIEDNSTVASGTLTLTNVILNSNSTGSAPGNGGGLHITGPGNATVTGGTVNSNSAAREGGGLWNGSGVMTLDAVTIDANTALGTAADDGGAGVFNNGGTLNIINGTMISNNVSTGTSASGGGLLSTAGDVNVIDSSFDSNSANRAGGAIEIIDGTLTFTNSVMSNNDVDGSAGTAAPGNGGGLHITGTSGLVTIETSTITGNSAANEGGGLWNQNGTIMNVSTSTIDNNTAGEGGGVFGNGGAITTVMTSTISANSASVSGGGVSNNGASFDVNASTIAFNTSTGNGGGIDAATNVSLKNTIVALNTAGSGTDVSGILTSNDYNLIGTDDLNVFSAQTNDIEEADPIVGPLQNNGGATLTHQLLNGSPAFNAGDSGDVFTDQIGLNVFDGIRDIGAYESQMTLSVEDFNQSAILSVYPNPTNGMFNVEIGSSISSDINLKVISITGTLVKETLLSTGLNTIDINGMASGLYFLNINSGNNSVTHKLILN